MEGFHLTCSGKDRCSQRGMMSGQIGSKRPFQSKSVQMGGNWRYDATSGTRVVTTTRHTRLEDYQSSQMPLRCTPVHDEFVTCT